MPSNSRWNKETNRAYEGSFSADFDGSGSGDLESLSCDCSISQAIYVDFWYQDDDIDATEWLLLYYDGSSWDPIIDLGATALEDQWLHYQEKITDPQYFHSDFKIRWSIDVNRNGEHAWVDLVSVILEPQNSYELNIEEQWTNVDYTQTNEWLSIYGGAMGSEPLAVDVWDGGGWTNLITSLQSGWNSFDVSSYLTSSTFKIRFRDEGLLDDTTQDSWEIDTIFLNVWT